jgi:hypothetical protein
MDILLIPIGMIAAVAFIICGVLYEPASDRYARKIREIKIAEDLLAGWKSVSNSRFGQTMYLCPVCAALTIHEYKQKHLATHTDSTR